MRNPLLRFGLALALGILCGVGVAVVLVILITIADLYIAGHSLDLPWWEVVRETVFLVATGTTMLFCTAVAWKSLRRNGKNGPG